MNEQLIGAVGYITLAVLSVVLFACGLLLAFVSGAADVTAPSRAARTAARVIAFMGGACMILCGILLWSQLEQP